MYVSRWPWREATVFGYRTNNPGGSVYRQCEVSCQTVCIVTKHKTVNIPYLCHFPFSNKLCIETCRRLSWNSKHSAREATICFSGNSLQLNLALTLHKNNCRFLMERRPKRRWVHLWGAVKSQSSDELRERAVLKAPSPGPRVTAAWSCERNPTGWLWSAAREVGDFSNKTS